MLLGRPELHGSEGAQMPGGVGARDRGGAMPGQGGSQPGAKLAWSSVSRVSRSFSSQESLTCASASGNRLENP